MKLFIYFNALLLVILAEGTGAWMKRMLGIARQGYHAPIGFALLFSLGQALYYPAAFFDMTMRWVIIVTVILAVFAVICVYYDWADIKDSLWRRESVVLLAVGLLFIVYYRFHEVLARPVEYTLLTARVRDLQSPLWQGYYQFAEAFSWLLNVPHFLNSALPAVTGGSAKVLGLGFAFTLSSTMLIIDFVRSFRLRNHWFEFALAIYLLLNGNYTAWTNGIAWSGFSWSALFVTLAVFIGYSYLRDENEQIKYLFIPVLSAGLFCDNSFGLSGLAILYGFIVYLFSIRKIRSFFDLFTFLIPHVIYGSIRISRFIPPFISVVFVLLYAAFIIRRYHPPIRRWITRSEEFFFDRWKEVFLIGVPAVLFISSVVIVILRHGNGLSSFLYYFSDFHEIPGMRDYLFVHSGWFEIVINIFRWGGLICLIALAKEKQDHGIRALVITALVVFLNPLTAPAISYMTGPGFSHCFHVLFNPVTEAIMFLYVYRMFQWNVIGQWVLEFALCFGALFAAGGFLR